MLGNVDNLPDGHAEYVSKLQNYGTTLGQVWKLSKYYALPVHLLRQVSLEVLFVLFSFFKGDLFKKTS